jgi:hypothetical protein
MRNGSCGWTCGKDDIHEYRRLNQIRQQVYIFEAHEANGILPSVMWWSSGFLVLAAHDMTQSLSIRVEDDEID